ncbi:unnamed protein product [Rotaria sp. Silwood2]|nr:unnamed protein product [Rotaria sp. Silwood2]
MILWGQRLIDKYDILQSNYVTFTALIEEHLETIYETAGTYLRFNDDLRHLSSDDRSIIVRSAADNVSCMSGSFIMQYCNLYGLDTYLKAMNVKYGQRTVDLTTRTRKFIDPDVVLVNLSISLFAFSENSCCYYSNLLDDLTNPIHILEIQNKYAEVTWKYLLYKYGHYDAVKRFLNLILWLCSMNVLAVHGQSVTTHVKDLDSIIEQTELTLKLDEVEEIIETSQ